ncbi:MAG: type ISP restriction/modification enzyme [Allosphingosinicella sp.]
MSLEEAVAAFGAAAKAKLSNPAVTGEPEDQLRAPLEGLFQQLGNLAGLPEGALSLVGETALADLKTRPDYSVTVRNALVGHIEVKAPGKGADPRHYRGHDKEQWERLKALPNLLYTDGNDFSLWRDGALVGGIVRMIGEVAISGRALRAPPALLALASDFLLGWEPIPPRSPAQLAHVSARLCRFLRDEVIEQMERGNPLLTELARDWRALLFPHANDEQFADGYAQAVTFGLLMAKSRGISLAEGFDDVARELGRANTLIGTALRLLTEQPEQAVLVTSLQTLVRVLDVVAWDQIARGDPEAWLYFYEEFLAVYDNSLRKRTGSYYTPPEVVQAMVRLCDEALRSPSRFGAPAGLAAPHVWIADPAMGSGTFLLGVLRRIAEHFVREEGRGSVGTAIGAATERLIGFELQFGAFAVAQLRLAAELIDLGATPSPRLFVTDTLGNPFEAEEHHPGLIGRVLSQSRAEANRIKAAQPITLVIGNPPYKEKAKGRGDWVEQGSGNIPPILDDWQPPAEWGVGAHAKHLRNLYVYFWRWAAWKVFEQGSGASDEALTGMVCYITVAGFLNGSGFQKMRKELRVSCDEIWVIDCTPEGHQPGVSTRIFQGVQHPVCIVLASRSPNNDPGVPARARFRALRPGRREEKFEELAGIGIDSLGWSECSTDWRAPFLPELSGGWADFVPLESLLGETGSGVMPGRTWIIAPDAQSLTRRWIALTSEKDSAARATLFHPHLRNGKPGDKHVAKAAKALAGHHGPVQAIDDLMNARNHPVTGKEAVQKLEMMKATQYGFRSFDRQWIIPDNRVINQPNPGLWEAHSDQQVYLTAPMDRAPSSGPAFTFTGLMPDLHHYAGRGGRVFALWRVADATLPNVAEATESTLALTFGHPVSATDLMSYIAAVAAHPVYTARFHADLQQPGLRIPMTADAGQFTEAATLGREVIWLHTFGERFVDPDAGRPAAPPRLPDERKPDYSREGTIPSDPDHMPDTIEYDASLRRLRIGSGFIDNVPSEVWNYEVSGKQAIRQWFSYRKKNRERPQIGDRREPSELGKIQSDRWLPEYTTELINPLNILGRLVDLEPRQADLLARVCEGPLIPARQFA